MASVFTMLPMSQTVNLTHGKTYRGYVTIANPAAAEEDFYYSASITPYSVLDADYTADLSTKSDWSMMVDWAEIENPTGVLKPNESGKIYFTITVPEDAPAGGQYAAITVRSNADAAAENGVQVQSVVEMASVIFAKVDGETVRSGEVTDNSMPGFVVTMPFKTSVTFVNEGNVHESATIKITIRDAWTGDVVFPKDDEKNTFSEMVMPETTRVLVREVSQVAELGAYDITQEVMYMGETYTTTQKVIACPLWFLILIIATVAVAIGTLVLRARKRKKARGFGSSDEKKSRRKLFGKKSK